MNAFSLPTLNHSKIKLYPNPTSDFFQVSGIEGAATIIISDLHCFVQLKVQIIGDESIPVKTLRNGIYIAKIITASGMVERKLTKV